jgi:two-component system response regulator YesN
MYKAVLCDDDQIIISGLEMILPWKELGIKVCGCANNGLEGKMMIEKFVPDILICDICMPFIDGLQLTKYAKELNPDIITIIVSGYDDFRYAQSAIKMGAMDYILKPIDEESIINQLKRAVEECKRREDQHVIFEESQRYLKEKMIKHLIYEGWQTSSQKHNEKQLKEIDSNFCSILFASIDNYELLTQKMTEDDMLLLNDKFLRCIKNVLSEGIGIFEQSHGTVGCYLYAKGKKQLDSIRTEVISKFRGAFFERCSEYSVTIACGKIYNNVHQIRESYREAKVALKERFVYPAGSVIFYECPSNNKKSLEKVEIEKLLTKIDFFSLIQQGDKNEISRQLSKLQNTLMKCGGKSQFYMRIVTGNLYAKLIKEFNEMGFNQENTGIDLVEKYRMAIERESIEDVISELGDIINSIIDAVDKCQHSPYSKIMAKALKYIENHYMECDLSLDDVANHVHISPSYFSVIFKTEHEMTFTDYLIKVRIEIAKELMRKTDLKLYEIAHRVGYDTAAYFSTAYKKYTGYSPSEFRKCLKKNKNFLDN